MSQALWNEVDEFVNGLLVPMDPVLEGALQESSAAGLPAIQVSRAQGKLLRLLAQAIGAHRVLEIGTLGAYSTIWIARSLPASGRLVTLEANPRHAEVARANLERAGLSTIVEVRLGPALETLSRILSERQEPFDLVFIDADKPGTAEYFDWAVRLSRPGAVIVVDNVVRKGTLVETESPDPAVQGMRRFLAQVSKDPRVSATVIQTVGQKGYDGFALAVVLPSA